MYNRGELDLTSRPKLAFFGKKKCLSFFFFFLSFFTFVRWGKMLTFKHTFMTGTQNDMFRFRKYIFTVFFCCFFLYIYTKKKHLIHFTNNFRTKKKTQTKKHCNNSEKHNAVIDERCTKHFTGQTWTNVTLFFVFCFFFPFFSFCLILKYHLHVLPRWQSSTVFLVKCSFLLKCCTVWNLHRSDWTASYWRSEERFNATTLKERNSSQMAHKLWLTDFQRCVGVAPASQLE